MKFGRRDFLRFGVGNALVLAAPLKVQAEENLEVFDNRRKATPSIVQGATDSRNTQFSILFNREALLNVVAVNAAGKEFVPTQMDRIESGDHQQALTNVFFGGLEFASDYTLLVKEQTTGQLLDERSFGLLDTSLQSLRFAICSCMDEDRHEPEIWKDLVENSPDMIFFIGDSVYADRGASSGSGANPTELWKKFCVARSILEIYFSKRLIPIFAVWDDHDFGRNDTGSNYPHVEASQKNFLGFFPKNPHYCSTLERGPGISSALTLSGQLFLQMDCRSFREKSGSRDRFAHWGREQEEWALDLIRRHDGPVWIMNGSQCFPEMPFKESFSGDHPQNFKAFLGELKRVNSRVVFVSGDVHFSELSKIEAEALGYVTYEVTSSSVHSRSVPGVPYIIPNRRREAATAERNYNLIDSQAQGKGVSFTLRCLSKNGQENYSRKLEV